MIALRTALLVVLAALASWTAHAQEAINRFDVTINVETNGDILVTEAITVTAEGLEIRRGIFRDLPRYYEQGGARLPYRYDVLEITRDGAAEPYRTGTDGNAYRIQIGDENVFLDRGAHRYEIRYRVRSQVRYFDRYDEVYWNATGNYWSFPILAARAEVILPDGAEVLQTRAYTGRMGDTGGAYTHRATGQRHTFESTRPLQPGEGLTVAVGFAKGVIDPPSAADRGWLWWQLNGSLVILGGTLVGLFWFFLRSFDAVGRDPPKGPLFPRYEPPKGYSPAATHHIYYRGVRGHQALIATLMNLAVKGRLDIDVTDAKVTELTQKDGGEPVELTAEDQTLQRSLFAGATTKTLGKAYDAGFTRAYTTFRHAMSRKYGAAYFRWNSIYTLGGIVLSGAAVAFAINQSSFWSSWHTAGILALAALNLVFMYLMPAPTPKGQRIRSEIEGFRLYMETAEKLQLNAVKVGGEAPPPMSRERYEAFLPYAVALGVEKPWTRHFERLMPSDAQSYSPSWARLASGANSLNAMNASLISSMSSGVTSALPQSSGSSGSGGGGSSGGGGGGGGGGGW